MELLAILHRLRWPLGISIAMLVAVFGGRVMGDMASETIEPFYANVVVPQARHSPTERLADSLPAGEGDTGGNSGIAAVDLGYASAAASAADDIGEPAQ